MLLLISVMLFLVILYVQHRYETCDTHTYKYGDDLCAIVTATIHNYNCATNNKKVPFIVLLFTSKCLLKTKGGCFCFNILYFLSYEVFTIYKFLFSHHFVIF